MHKTTYYFIWYSGNHPSHDEKAVDILHARFSIEERTVEYYVKYYRFDNKIKSEMIPSSMNSVIGITDKDAADDKILKVQEYYKINNGLFEIIEEDYEK